ELPDMNYAQFAELAGLRGIRVERPGDVAGAWDEALSADRPVVIDALTDPSVPPLPPHITLKQAKAMMFALAKDDPDRAAGVGHPRVELCAALLGDQPDRLLHGPGRLVGPVVGQRVEDVCHGHDPAAQRDRLAGQPRGIAGAVPVLVMREGDLGRVLEDRRAA